MPKNIIANYVTLVALKKAILINIYLAAPLAVA